MARSGGGGGCFGAIALIVVGVAAGLYFMSSGPTGRRSASLPQPTAQEPAAEPASKPALQIDRSPEAQAKRDELIHKLVNDGVFKKVEPRTRGLVSLYVDRKWYLADVDQKKAFASLVLAWAEGADVVMIRDGYSDKKLGTFSAERGLELAE